MQIYLYLKVYPLVVFCLPFKIADICWCLTPNCLAASLMLSYSMPLLIQIIFLLDLSVGFTSTILSFSIYLKVSPFAVILFPWHTFLISLLLILSLSLHSVNELYIIWVSKQITFFIYLSYECDILDFFSGDKLLNAILVDSAIFLLWSSDNTLPLCDLLILDLLSSVWCLW